MTQTAALPRCEGPVGTPPVREPDPHSSDFGSRNRDKPKSANSSSARVGRNQFAPVPVFQSWLAVAAATLRPSIVVIVVFVGPAESHCSRQPSGPRVRRLFPGGTGIRTLGPPARVDLGSAGDAAAW
jgi:hypothetical protein